MVPVTVVHTRGKIFFLLNLPLESFKISNIHTPQLLTCMILGANYKMFNN